MKSKTAVQEAPETVVAVLPKSSSVSPREEELESEVSEIEAMALAVSVQNDEEYEAAGKPEIANIILTSMIKNVGNSLVWAYDKEVEGTLEWGTNVSLGIAADAVGPAESGAFLELDESLLEEYAQVKEDVASGKVTVGTAFGHTLEEQQEFANTFRP